MLKFLALALLVAVASAECGCQDTISALEKRIELLEGKLTDVVANCELGRGGSA